MAKVSTTILLAVIMAVALGAEATEPFIGTIMKHDDEHIGGKEIGPTRFRFFGNDETARERVGLGRLVLGELKKKMQLGGLLQHRTPTIEFDDGTLILAKSIFGQDGLADIDEVFIDVTNVPAKEVIRDKCYGFIARIIAKTTHLSGGNIRSDDVAMEVIEPDDDVYYPNSGIGPGQVRPLYGANIFQFHTTSGDYQAASDGNYFVNTYGDWDFNTDPTQDTFQFWGREINRGADTQGNPFSNEAIMVGDARQRYNPNVRMLGANYFFNSGQIVLGITPSILSLFSSETGYTFEKDKSYNPDLFNAAEGFRMDTVIAVGLPTAKFRTTYNYQDWGVFPMAWKQKSPMPKGDYEIVFAVGAPGTEASVDIWFPDSRIPPYKTTVVGSSTTNPIISAGGYLANKRYFVHVGKEIEWYEGIKNPYVKVEDR